MRSSTSSTCAWIVTSSAVVGSSAISRSGSLAIDIAIIARCRMPPEYSCGYWSTRCSGFGMPTMSSSSMHPLVDARRVDRSLVHRDRLGDLVADLVHRVQRGERVLEDHRDLRRRAAARSSLLRQPEERLAAEQHLAGDLAPTSAAARGSPSRSRSCPSPTRPRCRASRSWCTSNDTSSTACTIAVVGRELDGEVAHREHRRAGHAAPSSDDPDRSTGSSASVGAISASPTAGRRRRAGRHR